MNSTNHAKIVCCKKNTYYFLTNTKNYVEYDASAYNLEFIWKHIINSCLVYPFSVKYLHFSVKYLHECEKVFRH